MTILNCKAAVTQDYTVYGIRYKISSPPATDDIQVN